jgi:hypothetical protein
MRVEELTHTRTADIVRPVQRFRGKGTSGRGPDSFRVGGRHAVIMRFSTNPGDILPDSISSPRGLAVKVAGVVNSEMVPNHVGQVTQDLVLVNGSRAFGAPDSAGFLKNVKLLEQHVIDSEDLKQFVSTSTAFLRTSWSPSAEVARR